MEKNDGKIKVQRLSDLLQNIDEDQLISIFQQFECELDKDIATFLYTLAIPYERKNVCRTYLLVETNLNQIVGYFAIGLNSFVFSKNIYIARAYDGMELYPYNALPVYELFLIGKDDKYKETYNMKEIFVNYCIPILKNCKKDVGGSIICLDCIPDLKDYYGGLGFEYYSRRSCKDEMLYQMIRVLD